MENIAMGKNTSMLLGIFSFQTITNEINTN